MRESIITILLGACSVVLAIIAVLGIVKDDKEAPVITLDGKNNLVYAEGDPYDELLENVTAEDEVDGDVTDTLRISNIHVISDDRAMVMYVAKDKSNNIGKLKREVLYQTKELASNTADTETDQSAESSTVKTAEQEAVQQINGSKVTLLQNEARLKVGETFNVFRYIASAVDVDGTNLSRYLQIEGTYDTSKQGVYPLSIYILKQNGERSNVETLTLIVEP